MDLFDQANDLPMAAHQLPHHRLTFNSAQQFIFFKCQHFCLLV
jgi:hypothetical protein